MTKQEYEQMMQSPPEAYPTRPTSTAAPYLQLYARPGRSRWASGHVYSGLVSDLQRQETGDKLYAEAERRLPNVQTLMKSILDKDLHSGVYQALGQNIQGEVADFMDRYSKEGLSFALSKEGAQKIRRLQAIANDPRLKTFEEIKKDNEKTFSSIDSDTRQSVNVSRQGLISVLRDNQVIRVPAGSLEEGDMPLTVANDYVMHDRLHGDKRVDYNMEDYRKVMDNIYKKLNTSGKESTKTEIRNITDGLPDGTLTVVDQSSNKKQINRLRDLIKNGNILSEGEINTLLSRYFTSNPDMLRNPDAITNAWAAIGRMVSDVAEGNYNTSFGATTKVDPSLSAAEKKHSMKETVVTAEQLRGFNFDAGIQDKEGNVLPLEGNVLHENTVTRRINDKVQDFTGKNLEIKNAINHGNIYLFSDNDSEFVTNRYNPDMLEAGLIKKVFMEGVPNLTSGSPPMQVNIATDFNNNPISPAKMVELQKKIREGIITDEERKQYVIRTGDTGEITIGENRRFLDLEMLLPSDRRITGGAASASPISSDEMDVLEKKLGIKKTVDNNLINYYNAQSGRNVGTSWGAGWNKDGIYRVRIRVPVLSERFEAPQTKQGGLSTDAGANELRSYIQHDEKIRQTGAPSGTIRSNTNARGTYFNP